MIKKCLTCQKEYNARSANPHFKYCSRKCHMKDYNNNNKEKFKKRYQDNKETIILRTKEWNKNNPEKAEANRKKYREKNREKYLKYQREYSKKHYEKNKEKYKVRALLWRKNNPEKTKECQKNYLKKLRKEGRLHKYWNKGGKDYYWRNRDKKLAENKQWAKDNPDKVAVINKRYRVKKKTSDKFLNPINDDFRKRKY